MGINDIFEPNRADFTPMTDEPGIYAKHIEQQIKLNIRTRANDQLRRTYLQNNLITINENKIEKKNKTM